MTTSQPRYADGTRPDFPGDVVIRDLACGIPHAAPVPAVERADEWVLFSDELCRTLAHDHEAYPEVVSLGTEGRGLGVVRYQRTGAGTLPGTQLYRRQP